jgi:hypothetical protein
MARKKKKSAGRSKSRVVHCDEHGEMAGCILCRHLCEGKRLGYWAIKPDATGPAQAWCDQCDVVLDEDRGWTDRGDALADWQLYCEKCYAKTLARHKLRGWSSGVAPP